MLESKTFVFIFFLLLKFITAMTTNSTHLPRPWLTFNEPSRTILNLTLYPFEKHWKNITQGNQIPTYSASENSSFTVRCEAPYPIQFIIEGYIAPPGNVLISPFHRYPSVHLNQSIYETKIFFRFFDPENAASAEIVCKGIELEHLKTSFKMFFQGKNTLINSGGIVTVQDSSLLPCATTDPTEAVFLKFIQVDPQIAKTLEYEGYEPTKGLHLSQPRQGNFSCNAGNETITIVSLTTNFSGTDGGSTFGTDEDFYFPETQLIHGPTNEPLEFHCRSASSTSEPIDIWADDVNAVLIYSINTTTEKKFTITETSPVISNVECYRTQVPLNESRIINWTYNISDYPELYVDNRYQQFNCLSDGHRTLTNIKCNDPSHCGFMRKCFDDPSWCNQSKEGYTFAESWTLNCSYFLDGENHELNAPCVASETLFLSGVVQCTGRGSRRTWEYFTALNSIRYIDYKIVPEDHLVRMDEVKSVLYRNKNQTFVCVAVSFLFANSVKFSLELKNGTETFEEDVDRALYINSGDDDPHPRKIVGLNVIAEIRIALPLEAVAVHCYAPWWNSTSYEKVTRKFVTKDLMAATITTPQIPHAIFTDGETHRRLTCPGKGEPAPSYEWFFYDKQGGITNVNERNEWKTYNGSEGEGILDFLLVTKNMTATYLCKASNWNGTDFFNFTVQVEDKSSGNPVFWIVIGVVLVLLCVVLGLTGLVMRRHMQTVQRLRELLDEEVDEFFAGRPELMGRALTQENASFWPYDKSFEIGLDDIKFDPSDVIGSGNFGFVFKGSVISRGVPVAIKFPKTTTETDEFKGMLTEIKIMIYIGHHDNIISFIGACTDFIRQRKVHILLELADNGSLHDYLRKHRPGQKRKSVPGGVISENDEKDNKTIRDLDLVRWSYEIAKGMEYLSYKSIVHADLATRNVLLNKNLNAKISDFGLSRQLYGNLNYTKKTKTQLPWRWMAIESLTAMEFSTESDVWSYGVSLWEIFSYGEAPYPNATFSSEFVDMLKSGIHLGKPRDATPEIYAKMAACWDVDKVFRPLFTTLRKDFGEFLKSFEKSEITSEVQPANHDVPSHCAKTENEGLYYNFNSNESAYANIELH